VLKFPCCHREHMQAVLNTLLGATAPQVMTLTRVKEACFSTTAADSISTAKLCRAACDEWRTPTDLLWCRHTGD